jgi:stress response protein YsnF
MNPWLIIALGLALGGVYGYGHHNGYVQKEHEDELIIAKKNEEMNDAKNKADAELAKANKQLASKGVALTNAIRNGQQRLFVPVATSAGCAAPATGDGQARAELDKSVGEALVRITLDGDKAILNLNSCIDRYNSIKEIAGDKR